MGLSPVARKPSLIRAKLLEEISKNTGVAVTSAEKFAGALNQIHLGQIRLGQGLLKGFTDFLEYAH